MNRDIEEQLVIRYGYFAGRLRNVYERYPNLVPPGLGNCRDLSVFKVGLNVVNDLTSSVMLLQAPIVDDLSKATERTGSSIRSASLDALLAFVGQAAPAIVNEIKDEILKSGSIEYGDAEKITAMVEDVDRKVTQHGNRLHNNKIWSYMGGTSIPCATFWEESKGQTTPLEERMVTRDKLNQTGAKHGYLCVIQDDSSTLWKNEPRAALIVSDGNYRPDPTEGAYKECYAIDVSLMLAKGYYNVINGVARNGDLETYFATAKRFEELNSTPLSELFRSAWYVLMSLADLTQYAVNEGYIERNEHWVNAMLGIPDLIKPLTAEDNPDAKFDIGGWS